MWWAMKGHARHLMTHPVKSVSPETPLTEIALLLADARIAGVPVTDEDEAVVGIISEPDILNALLSNRALDTPARELMTSPVHTVNEFETSDEVMALFRKHGVHHLPVVREDKLLGIITPADVIRYLARDIDEPPRVG
jgi:CBS domain-containing protein